MRRADSSATCARPRVTTDPKTTQDPQQLVAFLIGQFPYVKAFSHVTS